MTTKTMRSIDETRARDEARFAFAKLRHIARLVLDGDPEAEAMARDLMSDAPSDCGATMRVRNGGVDVTGGWVARLWVGIMGEALDGSGAENYLHTEFKRRGDARATYSVTIQREGKLTPHAARVRAEAERDRALARVAELEERLHMKARARR